MSTDRFSQLYLQLQGQLVAYFNTSTLQWLKQELAADTWLRVWRFRPQAGPEDSAYVWSVARTVLTDQFRWKARHAHRAVHVDISNYDVAQAEPEPDLWPRVLSALDAIPEHQAQVVRMHYLENMPLSAVADHMQRAYGTIRHYSSEARHSLRELLVPRKELTQ